ncbi:hypothetical protein SCP_0113570 [Sparassis crispa]|uniref:DUF6533 domain-containing protein n=1 Tax=Sparassis crispa TaxID=139825 RepID=A0A401G8I8_9APHY|nr:hypothetical protein SCP_0113570 [Sparassis crispa]GBE78468.1 hypothetical protein SCP_0113570 [Sparassis crispa]
MDTSPQAVLRSLQGISGSVSANRYLTAAGLTLLIYDTVLTLGDEIRLVWFQPIDVTKLVFLFTRYGVISALLSVANVTSGMASHTTKVSVTHAMLCQGWIIAVGVSTILSTASTNFVLIVRVYALYDHRKKILRILIYACVLTFSIGMVFGALALRELIASMIWEPLLYRTCILTSQPHYLVGYWAPQVAFELFTFLLTIFNAAERPRRAQSKLVTDLYRDGFLYIFILFWIRVLNMALSAVPDAAYNLLTPFFTWSVTILTLSRLVLRVEDMRRRAGTMHGHVDALELTLQHEAHVEAAVAGRFPFITVNTVTTEAVI